MPTGQQIVSNALTILGLMDPGGTPSASDSQDLLNELNSMWAAWGIDEGLIFAVQPLQFAWTGSSASNPIGPGAAAPFDVPTPSRIYAAYWVTSSGRNEIAVVDARRFFAHNDLAATAKTPDEIYPNWLVSPTTGQTALFPWPVPSQDGTLELTAGATFIAWALGTNYNLPQGYQDPLQYALAFRGLPRFGAVVAPQVAQVVTEIGSKAELRLRSMNRMNRQLPEGAEMLEPPKPPANPLTALMGGAGRGA